MMHTPATLLAQRLAIAVPALLLGGAYVSQYVFGLFPCEMCWWQRYPHFLALGLGLLAAFLPLQLAPKRVVIGFAALAIFASGLIGGFHAGVEYGWWEGITGCATHVASSGGSALENIMNAPLVRCDVAPWDFLGISLAGWNFILSIGAACAILALLMRRSAA